MVAERCGVRRGQEGGVRVGRRGLACATGGRGQEEQSRREDWGCIELPCSRGGEGSSKQCRHAHALHVRGGGRRGGKGKGGDHEGKAEPAMGMPHRNKKITFAPPEIANGCLKLRPGVEDALAGGTQATLVSVEGLKALSSWWVEGEAFGRQTTGSVRC